MIKSTPIRMPEELWEKAKAQAKKEIRSANSLVVRAVQLYLDKMAGGEPLQESLPQISKAENESSGSEDSEDPAQVDKADNKTKPEKQEDSNCKRWHTPKEPIKTLEERKKILEQHCVRPKNPHPNTAEAAPAECPACHSDRLLVQDSDRTFQCQENCSTVGYF